MTDTVAFVEQRIYTLAAGQVPTYLKLYEAEGLSIQLEVLQRLVGYYSVDVGTLNTVVHLWAYSSHDDRDARRARMQASPVWQGYWAKARQLILSQQCAILKPAPFFTNRLSEMLTRCSSSV